MKLSLSVLLLGILLTSCKYESNSGVITYEVIKSDYTDKMMIKGTVQAVVNFPVVPPRSMFGQMTVLRLAADGSFVRTGDTICVLTVPELESRYLQSLTAVESLEAELKKTQADNKLSVALLEAQLATSEAQLKISSLDSLRMRYATTLQQKLLTLEMQRSLIEKQKTEKKLIATKSIGENTVRQMNARIMQEKMKAQTMESQVKAMTITAQRDGYVSRTESPQITIMSSQGMGQLGGPVKEGSVLFMDTPVLLFPDLSKMQVSAEVTEGDFRKIEKGQKVRLTVEAAGTLITTGKVNRKSLMGRTAQRWSDSKVKFYEVIIDVDSCHSKMKPGLSASCEVMLTEVRDTLFVPTLAVFERDSSKIVYVKGKKYFTPVKVQTGMSGSSFTIIPGGLSGGETIALSEPPKSLIAPVKEDDAKHENELK
jgi:hypothetical protein